MTKVAVIQMCSSKNIDDNLNVAKKLIMQAAFEGAKCIVLPEMFAIIGDHHSDKVMAKESYGSGKIQDFLSQQACQSKVWLIGGTIPIATLDPHKVRAACMVIDDSGERVARYDKIHLFDAKINSTEIYQESSTTEPGNETVIIDSPIGKLGLAVCFDLRFPEHFLQLAKNGAEVIVVPSAFTQITGRAHWSLLMRCRAIDSFCFMLGASQGGTHPNGRKTYGHSMIVDPWGWVIDEVTNPGLGIAYADINLKHVEETRMRIPFNRD